MLFTLWSKGIFPTVGYSTRKASATPRKGKYDEYKGAVNCWKHPTRECAHPPGPLASALMTSVPSLFPSHRDHSHLHSDITIAEYRECDYRERSLTPILYFKTNQHIPESTQGPFPLPPRSSRGPRWETHSPFQNEATCQMQMFN